jgi:hypothetical protein
VVVSAGIGVVAGVLVIVVFVNALVEDLESGEWWLGVIDAFVALAVAGLMLQAAHRSGRGAGS